MPPRCAIVVAAHDNPLLRPLTMDRPPALLEVGGRPLIDHQLACCARCGIESVRVVAGHQAETLCDHLAARADVVDNRDHATTGSLYSLWLARDWLRAGAVIVAGDLLFAPRLLERLLMADAPDAILVDRADDVPSQAQCVSLAGAFVNGLDAGTAPASQRGTAIGLFKVGGEGARRLLDILHSCVAGSAAACRATVLDAIAALAQSWPVVAIDTDGMRWARMTSVDDVAQASRVVAAARLRSFRNLRAAARQARDRRSGF